MFTESEFEAILKRSEGPSLDFKAGGYDFSIAATRNEFIKDVISMANTPRNGPAYIVLGIKWTAGQGCELTGLSEQHDDFFFQDKLGKDRISPLPSILYHPLLYQEKNVGVIEMSVNKRGPFLPLKSYDDFLREGQIYVRRGTENVAANNAELREVISWFKEDCTMTTASDQSDAWRRFIELTHGFEAGRRFVLLVDCVEAPTVEALRGWGLVPWCAVFDFDPNSDESGFLKAVDATISTRRTVVRTVKGDRQAIYPGAGTLWFFTRGLWGRSDTLETALHKAWVREYGREIDQQLEALVRAVSPAPITAVVLWNHPGLSRHLGSVLESFIKTCGDIGEAVAVTPDRSLVEELCSQYDVEVVEASITSISAGLEDFFDSIASGPAGRCAIPTASGAARNIEAKDRLWLEEELEIVHLDSGLDGPDTADQFRKGATPSWRDLNLSHDCSREITDKIRRRIEEAVEKRRTERINLYHTPGAGGTTVARRALWDLHRRYPCAVLRRAEPGGGTSERLAKLTALAEQGLVLLIDGSEHSEREINDLYEFVASQQTPVVMVQVLRRFSQQPSSRWEFWLPAELTIAEADRFFVAYSAAAPGRTEALKKLQAGDPRQRTAFYFGLHAFGRDFRGLPTFVGAHMGELSDVQKRMICFLAIAHHYGQQALPAQSFAGLFSLPVGRKIDLTKALPSNAFDLIMEAEPGLWRTSHDLIADEIMKQLLSPQYKDRDRLWRQQLSEWAIAFAHFTRGRSQILAEQMIELSRRVFVYRDNVELLGTERSAQRQFSQIIEDIPSSHGQLEVFRTLTQVFPEEAHFQAHLGRFCGLIDRFEEGLAAIDHAIMLQPRDPLLHHMRGMILRYQVNDLIDRKQQLEQVVQLTREACQSFEGSRQIDPGNEHGYVSEVQLLLHVLDYAGRGHQNVLVYLFAPNADIYLRESIDRVETLLDQLRNVRAGEQPSIYEIRCRAELDGLYGDDSAALRGWDNLLGRKDAVKPPIRRQIVWTLLKRRKGDWAFLESKEIRRCVDLLEGNLAEDPNDATSLRLWIRAVRHSSTPPSLDRLIERVSYWKANTNSLNAAYYLYVFHTLLAIEGSALSRGDADHALEDCRNLSRVRRNRHRSFEWLGQGDGVQQLTHESELGEWELGFWKNTTRLTRLEGRIASIDAPQRGTIELRNGQEAFFVPVVAGFHQARDENCSVEFFLGFSYDGLRAWQVTART
ncbi:MAG: ATP-binding protein [Phycisphaerae bacterium]|nr:ATP-binding protein [Phycisphaerae bacterium]